MPKSAPVAELADAHGSGPCSERSGGSTPLGRTRLGGWMGPIRAAPHHRSKMTHQLHWGALPESVEFGSAVAVDTEAMGLNPHRDRLCLVQLSAGDGHAHLVQFAPGAYTATRLRCLLLDPGVTKLFHFARFDLA